MTTRPLLRRFDVDEARKMLADVERYARALSLVIDMIARLDHDRGARGITAREIVTALYPAAGALRDDTTGDGFGEAREAIEHLSATRPRTTPNTTKLGLALRGARGCWLGGRRLVSVVDGHNKVSRWRVEQASKEGASS